MSTRLIRFGSSGLAGVWAEENTREAIYEAFKRKETLELVVKNKIKVLQVIALRLNLVDTNLIKKHMHKIQPWVALFKVKKVLNQSF